MNPIVRGMLAAGIAASLCGCAVHRVSGSPPEIAGAWTLVANVQTGADGRKVDAFGANPKGTAIFTPDGHFAVITARGSLPKFASGNRLRGTPEENQAIVHGSLAAFGRYQADAGAKTIRFDIDNTTWPSWIGTSSLRKYTLERDELRWTLDASMGGTAEVVWKRMR